VKQITRQVHRRRALAVLGADPQFRWLANKPEILDELGRIESDYALQVIAQRLCELKPHTHEAIEMIGRHREFNQLADEIVHVVNDYIKRNPTTSRSDIIRALETAGLLLGSVDGMSKPGRHQFLQKVQHAAVRPVAEAVKAEA